jgi:hypothetical protein
VERSLIGYFLLALKNSLDFFITTQRQSRVRRACAMKNSSIFSDIFITPRMMDMPSAAHFLATTELASVERSLVGYRSDLRKNSRDLRPCADGAITLQATIYPAREVTSPPRQLLIPPRRLP